ncbi:MAG: hypothetical protein ABIT09_11190 [Croceibacterium sp.]
MSSNVILLIIVALLVLGLLAWLFAASRRTRVELEPRPLDEPARRNQALIDATRVAGAVPSPVVPDMPLAASLRVAPAGGDDLTRLKGVGPKLADQLRTLGVTSFDQVAAWQDADIDRIDALLGRFQGRIRRDDWRAQASFLATGDTAGYESKFGRL